MYGWSSGGTLVTLVGITWPLGSELMVDLVLRMPLSRHDEPALKDSPTPCTRVDDFTATCITPPAALPNASSAAMFLFVRNAGDLHIFDLQMTFSFTPVPVLTSAEPLTAPIIGGTPIEIHGGTFDSKVKYFCGWTRVGLPDESEKPDNSFARVCFTRPPPTK